MSAALLVPTLVGAVLAAGLVAGFLAAFAHTVMPGIGATDDATFVSAFQAMDRAVYNPWFMVPFALAPVLVAAALLLSFGSDQRDVRLLIGLALVLVVGTVAITGVVHLPLNESLGEVPGGAGAVELADARSQFESRWVRWNVARSVTSTGAFASLLLAVSRVH